MIIAASKTYLSETDAEVLRMWKMRSASASDAQRCHRIVKNVPNKYVFVCMHACSAQRSQFFCTVSQQFHSSMKKCQLKHGRHYFFSWLTKNGPASLKSMQDANASKRPMFLFNLTTVTQPQGKSYDNVRDITAFFFHVLRSATSWYHVSWKTLHYILIS